MQPMSFGGVYSYTFWLIRQTIGPTILAIITLGIFAGLVGYSFNNAFHSFTDLIQSLPMDGNQMDKATAERVMREFLSAMMPMLLTGFVAFLAMRFAQALVTNAGWDAALDERRSLGELAGASLGRAMWMSVLQWIIIAILWIAISLVASILISAIGRGSAGPAVAMIFGYLLQALWIWFMVATSTSTPMIAVESRGPWKSLVASISLGRGSWWRNFALLLVPCVIVIGINILVSLISASSISPEVLGSLQSQPNDPQNPAEAIARMQTLMQVLSPMMISLVAVFAIITPFFYHLCTAIYIDMRARRGDFELEGEEDEDRLDGGAAAINW